MLLWSAATLLLASRVSGVQAKPPVAATQTKGSKAARPVFPVPPPGLTATGISVVVSYRNLRDDGVDQFSTITFRNDTAYAFDAVEVELSTQSGKKTVRRRVVLKEAFSDVQEIHTGSILPDSTSTIRNVKTRIPVEYWTFGRINRVKLIGARRTLKPLDPKNADSVWIFMRTATPGQIAATLRKRPDLVTARYPKGTTLTLMAATRREPEILDAVLKAGGSLEDRTARGLTLLHLAATTGSEAVVTRLLRDGLAIEAKTKVGQTPLHFALLFRNLAAMEALLKRGADINARNALGATPLVLSPSRGDLKIAELLIARGADLRAADQDGLNFMNAAASTGQIPFLKLGTKHGLTLDGAEPKTGLTPLHLATRHYRRETVGWLLDQGVDPEVRNLAGETPLEYWRKIGISEIDLYYMKETFATHRKPSH